MQVRVSYHCIVFYFLLAYSTLAQKQSNIWCFGRNATLDFSSGNPQQIANSRINTLEGCASIADENGNLLFYTDGVLVWDKTHTQMPNGFDLKGDPSSTQSAIITPVPGKPKQYYIFTVCGGSCFSSTSEASLYYSIVDMTLQGNGISSPLGDIIDTIKNKRLVRGTEEKITAILHEDRRSYWVVVPTGGQRKFYAYRVTHQGISSPVISSFNSLGDIIAGYMKTSKDGKMIVAANVDLSANFFTIYNFDPCTGMVSDRQIVRPNNGSYIYSIEFSPNDSLIYISGSQYQRYATNINNSRVNLSFTASSLQLANNGKIYFTIANNNPLIGCIETPNVVTNPTILPNAITLTGGALTEIGLPTFFNLYLGTEKLHSLTNKYAMCYGDSALIGPDTSFSSYNYSWSPSAGLNAFNITNPIAKPDTTTEYILTTTSPNCSVEFKDSVLVEIRSHPLNFLGSDTILCHYQLPFVLNAYLRNSNYVWMPDSLSTPSLTIDVSGRYQVTVSDDSLACATTDSILVTINDCIEGIFIPSAFSPNNDGINDFFEVKFATPITNYQCSIFNRWGELIYSSIDPLEFWDGKHKDKFCSDGIYWYQVSYNLKEENAPRLLKGTLVLIK